MACVARDGQGFETAYTHLARQAPATDLERQALGFVRVGQVVTLQDDDVLSEDLGHVGIVERDLEGCLAQDRPR